MEALTEGRLEEIYDLVAAAKRRLIEACDATHAARVEERNAEALLAEARLALKSYTDLQIKVRLLASQPQDLAP